MKLFESLPDGVNVDGKRYKLDFDFRNVLRMMEILADASLVNPSYEDIKKADIQLTENQLMSILMYSQGGIKALENFRSK